MTIRTVFFATALGLAAFSPVVQAIQHTMAGSHMSASNHMNMMADGEVRKLDLAAGKITIKHGPIAHMDMPGMTMVFTAKDRALLDKIKVGDKIRFMVSHEDGKMMVTDIQPAN